MKMKKYYKEIFDRQPQDGQQADDIRLSLARYAPNQPDGLEMASPEWCQKFIEAGGGFDSQEVWGIHPTTSATFESEYSNVPAEFFGEMLRLAGRVDGNYFPDVVFVFELGFHPSSRSEFYAIARGIFRNFVAELAGFSTRRSIERYGWMKPTRWAREVLEQSRRVVPEEALRGLYSHPESGLLPPGRRAYTGYWDINGIRLTEELEEKLLGWDLGPAALKFLKGRPTQEEYDRRRDRGGEGCFTFATFEERRKGRLRPIRPLAEMPVECVGAMIRNGIPGAPDLYYPTNPLVGVEVGSKKSRLIQVRPGDDEIILSPDTPDGVWSYELRAKLVQVVPVNHLEAHGLSVAHVDDLFVVWDTQAGLKKGHVTAVTLAQALERWEEEQRLASV